MKECVRCIYDERVPGIEFDGAGVCNYCLQTDLLQQQYGTGEAPGEAAFASILEEIRYAGRRRRYDCIIGVSGGTDSSFLLHLAKVEWKLRPLAVHYDNTWNSAIATQNISKVLGKLKIDLYTHVVDNRESDDILRSFFLAGVPELDAATDLALAETMYRAAYANGVHFVLEGHSFMTEGITPLGKNYFDGRYIQSIHRRFGRVPMSTYPLMTFNRFLRWAVFARIRKIRPFWYLAYTKEAARALLEAEYGWHYYGGHHLENRVTAFAHSYYLPRKFGADLRNNTLSALVRMGTMPRDEAREIYGTPPTVDGELLNYVMKRFSMTRTQFDEIMSAPPRAWTDFPTYKKRFERLRPLFRVLAGANLVPMSFYLKYCFPSK